MTSLFSSASWMIGSSTDGYGTWPIPHALDQKIGSLIENWCELPREDREREATTISEEQAAVLRAFSERMATLAVRNSDQHLLILGLLALGIDGGSVDWREDTLILSLHLDAAKKVGVAPDNVFCEAGKLLPGRVSEVLTGFLNRSPEDQSLETMGYEESSDEGGFRYRRTW
jgi:hypothetical protein